MDSIRKTALVAGVLYLLTFAGSIAAALLLGPANNDPSLSFDAIPSSQIRLAAVFELVNALTCFGTAVAVFSVVRREHEGLALGFVATRLFEAAALGVGILALLVIATLRDNGESLAGVGPALIAVRFWSVVIGPGMASFNALMFGTLLYRSGLVPRVIPALGIAGAPIYISWTVAMMLGLTATGTLWQGIAVAPFFIWELVVGLWMTFKGFNRGAPIIAGHSMSQAHGSAALSAKAGAA